MERRTVIVSPLYRGLNGAPGTSCRPGDCPRANCARYSTGPPRSRTATSDHARRSARLRRRVDLRSGGQRVPSQTRGGQAPAARGLGRFPPARRLPARGRRCRLLQGPIGDLGQGPAPRRPLAALGGAHRRNHPGRLRTRRLIVRVHHHAAERRPDVDEQVGAASAQVSRTDLSNRDAQSVARSR